MNDSLEGLKIFVIGAGPGGLVFARGASKNGAEVVIYEQAGDPRGENAGYTDKSFNLTLNNVGRKVLDDDETLKKYGIDIFGRAVHDFQGTKEIKYTSYGEGDSARLTSIPRPVLRQCLVDSAENQGVHIVFRAKVSKINPKTSEITVSHKDGSTSIEYADLIVIADGLTSIADSLIEEQKGSLNKRQEEYNYVTVQLTAESSKNLSPKHIHFWHKLEVGAMLIGVPSKDGSNAVLMVSKFNDIGINESPFETLELSENRIKRDFSQLLELDPNIAKRLVGRMRGRFYYKTISKYVLGERTVIAGDAGITVPPWAAFGANTAIYGADALVRFLVGYDGDVTKALKAYEKHQLILADLVAGFVSEHGKFLTGDVTVRPDERSSSPVLGHLINEAVSKSEYKDTVKLLSF